MLSNDEIKRLILQLIKGNPGKTPRQILNLLKESYPAIEMFRIVSALEELTNGISEK